ncbi:S8 family serine peptidase [Nocardioides piscis]|uniref:S8 family serine peptidase n=1 Tax=Nocardioides piscis TaxID=2714938 RepID=A0A6G7YF56_9ACTN|nr:S8 family serine peptidase [Nocardioides piscis]QIK75359.1 S8 family serine peptidase [Nocardioides piscis]
MTSSPTATRAVRLALSGVVAGILAAGALVTPAVHAVAEEPPSLHLVTLTGPGTSAPAAGGSRPTRAALLARQDSVLAGIDAAEPAYRWTTALNGFAVALTADQVSALEADSEVVTVEANSVRPMAGRLMSPEASANPLSRPREEGGRGGAGVVIGVVDSGIDPESPLFADVPYLGPDAANYSGLCTVGEEWPAAACNRKLVGAGWWVAGFGEDRIRSSETLSARDAIGHGTQVASVAAGNSDVSVRIDQRTTGTFSGVAPRARVAAYKACWAAPDPVDDGCATADLVSAIDQATADGVDVLNVSTAGPSTVDTVQRALLGAAEADIVVIGAAGNAGRSALAGHPTPWVTTVGAARGSTLRGQVRVAGGPSLTGASRSRRDVGPVQLILGSDVAAAGARVRDARECRPDSLDAGQVAGKAVVCVRGGIGRVDKSLAVSRADGVAMVLVNDRAGGPSTTSTASRPSSSPRHRVSASSAGYAGAPGPPFASSRCEPALGRRVQQAGRRPVTPAPRCSSPTSSRSVRVSSAPSPTPGHCSPAPRQPAHASVGSRPCSVPTTTGRRRSSARS